MITNRATAFGLCHGDRWVITKGWINILAKLPMSELPDLGAQTMADVRLELEMGMNSRTTTSIGTGQEVELLGIALLE